jgi:peptidoglycan/xylan/chitin deacetylase (PgdA/CDA1 family)
VLPSRDELFPGEIDARRFDQMCRWVRQWFNVLPATEAVERLQDARLPPRALTITFDDGYSDNHEVALAVLERHGLTATFFVATGYLGGGRMWNDTVIESVRRTTSDTLDLGHIPELAMDRLPLSNAVERRHAIDRLLHAVKYRPPAERQTLVAAIAQASGATLPTDLMMSPAQVARLHAAGMTIGAHTVSHPILRNLDDAAAERELAQSRSALEQIVQAPVELFAYPNGRPGDDFGPRDVALAARCGFKAAFTTAAGAARLGTDVFQLPRFTPWRQQKVPFGLQLAGNLFQS